MLIGVIIGDIVGGLLSESTLVWPNFAQWMLVIVSVLIWIFDDRLKLLFYEFFGGM